MYRKYAGLFFTVCVDVSENELIYLELIHLFVEILDHYFNYVKEVHLVYNFHKVFVILDELVLSGEPQETSKKVRRESACFLHVTDGASSIVVKIQRNTYKSLYCYKLLFRWCLGHSGKTQVV